MKKYGICFVALFAVCSFFGVIGYAKFDGKLSHVGQMQKSCALCGEEKDSLKSIYGKIKGIGLLCLNDWRVVQVLTSEDGNMKGRGISYLRGEENDYSVQIEHVVESKISLVNYTGGKGNVPNMKKLSENLCMECLQNVREAVTIQGEHGKRNAKAVCLVKFPSVEVYAIQQNFQYYMLDEYYVQSYCEKKKINLTAFMVSPDGIPNGAPGEKNKSLAGYGEHFW